MQQSNLCLAHNINVARRLATIIKKILDIRRRVTFIQTINCYTDVAFIRSLKHWRSLHCLANNAQTSELDTTQFYVVNLQLFFHLMCNFLLT
jgi:hypothetical protein